MIRGRNILLHQQLEVVAPACPMHCIYSLRVLNVLDQVLQLTRRVPWQPREPRFLPEADEEVQVAVEAGAVAVGRPDSVWSHDMDVAWSVEHAEMLQQDPS